MRLEFSSTRAPGPPPLSDGRWQRSYWPGGILFAAGLALYLPALAVISLLGHVAGIAGACLMANALVTRRRAKADADREPRLWTIDDEQLRAANSLGSVRWTWPQVRRVDERPEVYLLYQSDSPHTAPFDVPRDTLTPDQDAQFRAFLAGRGLLAAG
jgi:hypothetical protein